jgi:2-isopropylmalate synthase
MRNPMTSSSTTTAAAKDRVLIFDTTMRDGEQSPGASMTIREKLELAELLQEMKVDICEAGFAASSEGDFQCVSQIAELMTDMTICSLARSTLTDIDRAGEAIRKARSSRIHTFISTSPVHMKHKLRMGENAVLEAVGASVTQSRKYTGDVEWSAEDATRSDFDFLCKAIDVAIRSGATVINVPDTVGYSHPAEYGGLIRRLIETIPDSDKVIWSTHCHNDLGLAVANSLAGVINGARQIECAVNGMGERAGNAALEECVMALKVRGDSMPFYTEVVTQKISRASKMVSSITGFPVQYNKAIVGKNAFAHESGIHQDGMLKHRETYEIMTPEDVGVPSTSLIMGKLSGRNAFRDKLEALGYVLEQPALNDAFKRFKDLADKKKHVFDEDIVALVDDQMAGVAERIALKRLKVVAGTDGPQTAEIELIIDGEVQAAQSVGNGPVDAVFNAIRALAPHEAVLELYQVSAVTEGTDAQATVSVRLADKINGKGLVATGKASDPDTLVASARAYVHALNKLEVRRQKAMAA